jgi:hypothetical protein
MLKNDSKKLDASKEQGRQYYLQALEEKDPKMRASLYRLAADKGHPEAQACLALSGCKEEAIALYTSAAARGSVDAQYYLNAMYANMKKEEISDYYLKSAADHGHPVARFYYSIKNYAKEGRLEQFEELVQNAEIYLKNTLTDPELIPKALDIVRCDAERERKRILEAQQEAEIKIETERKKASNKLEREIVKLLAKTDKNDNILKGYLLPFKDNNLKDEIKKHNELLDNLQKETLAITADVSNKMIARAPQQELFKKLQELNKLQIKEIQKMKRSFVSLKLEMGKLEKAESKLNEKFQNKKSSFFNKYRQYKDLLQENDFPPYVNPEFESIADCKMTKENEENLSRFEKSIDKMMLDLNESIEAYNKVKEEFIKKYNTYKKHPLHKVYDKAYKKKYDKIIHQYKDTIAENPEIINPPFKVPKCLMNHSEDKESPYYMESQVRIYDQKKGSQKLNHHKDIQELTDKMHGKIKKLNEQTTFKIYTDKYLASLVAKLEQKKEYQLSQKSKLTLQKDEKEVEEKQVLQMDDSPRIMLSEEKEEMLTKTDDKHILSPISTSESKNSYAIMLRFEHNHLIMNYAVHVARENEQIGMKMNKKDISTQSHCTLMVIDDVRLENLIFFESLKKDIQLVFDSNPLPKILNIVALDAFGQNLVLLLEEKALKKLHQALSYLLKNKYFLNIREKYEFKPHITICYRHKLPIIMDELKIDKKRAIPKIITIDNIRLTCKKGAGYYSPIDNMGELSINFISGKSHPLSSGQINQTLFAPPAQDNAKNGFAMRQNKK